MKKIILSIVLAGITLGFNSCSKDDQEEPMVQWFPVVTLEGEETCMVPMGDTDWTLPGFTAVNTLTGQDASDAVTVYIEDVIYGGTVTSIPVDRPGMFVVHYVSEASMVQLNPAFEMEKTRTVYVYDSTVTTDIGGTWMVNVNDSYRIRYAGDNAGQELSFAEVAAANESDISAGIPVEIEQILPGFYYVDDITAGLVSTIYDYVGYYAGYPVWYWQNYAYLSLNTENELSYLTGGFGYTPWTANYGVTGFEDGMYDPETGTISYSVDMGGQGFYLDIVLEQP